MAPPLLNGFAVQFSEMGNHATTVLVVGLDAANTRVLADVLSSRGLRPSIVAATEEAAQRCRAERPAAVILDTDAGGLPESCDLRRNRDVPVLVASSEAAAGAVVDAMHRGVAGVLRKPFAQAEVTRLLDKIRENGLDKPAPTS